MKTDSLRGSAARSRVSNEVGEFNQSIPSVNPSDVTISNRNQPIDKFFRRKQEELQKKESNFSKILDSKEFQSLSNNDHSKSLSKVSRFSKTSQLRKEEEKQQQLRGVIDEHKKMLGKLQARMRSEEELNEFEKNLLKEEKNRYLLKVEELEAEIQQLYRDNYKLRELEKTKQQPADTFHIGDLDEKTKELHYQPYVISTRNNDLNRINARNYQRSQEKEREDVLGNKLEREKPISAGQFFNKKPNNFGLYEEKFPSKSQQHSQEEQEDNYILKDLLGSSFDRPHPHPQPPPSRNPQHSSKQSVNASMESINRGGHFDTFQMANSLSYVHDSAINESRQMVHMSSIVSTRNKVAFFKNSLVLVREPQFEIAYKRSDMNEAFDKLRIIFYVNNKSSVRRTINFNYEYQSEYFQITVIEKLTEVAPNAQSREVIEVALISTSDLNGVTDVHVAVDNTMYDLWLPATFIRFRQTERYRMQNDEEEMNVLPDRQFASFNSMAEVAPLIFGGRDQSEEWGYLFGQCRFGSFTAKLTWHGHELTLQAPAKWIDFLGFVVHFFK